MKSTIVLIFASAMLAACGAPAANNSAANVNTIRPANAVATASPSNAAAASNATNAANVGGSPANTWAALRSSVGKTASEIKLWDNKDISTRLEKLMGADYATMKKFWNTETPIKASGDVVGLTGCENNNCGDNQYIIVVDTKTDNINVVQMKKGVAKDYKEKGDITIPKDLADDLPAMKSTN